MNLSPELLQLMGHLLPELMLLVAALLALLMSTNRQLAPHAPLILSPLLFLGLFACLSMLFSLPERGRFLHFDGTFRLDSFILSLKGLIFICAIALNLGASSLYRTSGNQLNLLGERTFLIHIATLGACSLISANDLMVAFVAMETLSLSVVALIGVARGDSLSGEAAFKYLLGGAVASAFFLFGAALFFGSTFGNTNFTAIAQLLQNPMAITQLPYLILTLSAVMIGMTVAFKLALAPMHMWAPDTYDGTSITVAALLGTISKVAGFGLLVRLGWNIFGISLSIKGELMSTLSMWYTIFAVFAIISMLIGNFVGLQQVFKPNGSIKRLLAYSSIAQTSYIITGAVIGSPESLSQSIFYLMLYILTNLATFVAMGAVENVAAGEHRSPAELDDLNILRGLFAKNPTLSIIISLCFAGLAGVLPSMLLAKFVLLESGVRVGLTGLLNSATIAALNLQDSFTFLSWPPLALIMAAVLAVSSIVSIFYYGLPILWMFSGEPIPNSTQQEGNSPSQIKSSKGLMVLSSILLLTSIALAFNPAWSMGVIASKAAAAAFIIDKPYVESNISTSPEPQT